MVQGEDSNGFFNTCSGEHTERIAPRAPGRTHRTSSNSHRVICGRKFISGELVFPWDSHVRSAMSRNKCSTTQMFRIKFRVSLASLAVQMFTETLECHGKEWQHQKSPYDIRNLYGRTWSTEIKLQESRQQTWPGKWQPWLVAKILVNLDTEQKAAEHRKLPRWIIYVASYHWPLCVFSAFAVCILSVMMIKTSFPATSIQ